MAPYGAIYYGAYAIWRIRHMAPTPYGACAIWRIRHMAYAPYGAITSPYRIARARRATQLSPVREKYNCSKSEGKKFAPRWKNGSMLSAALYTGLAWSYIHVFLVAAIIYVQLVNVLVKIWLQFDTRNSTMNYCFIVGKGQLELVSAIRKLKSRG